MAPKLVNALARQRLLAKVIDVIPPAAAVLAAHLLGGGTVEWMWAGVFVALYCSGSLVWEAVTGRSPGNLALGLVTVSKAGSAPGLVAVLVRALVLVAFSIVPVLGPLLLLISNIWDRNGRRRAWHDKLVGTYVLDARAGRNPRITGGLSGTEGRSVVERAGDDGAGDTRAEDNRAAADGRAEDNRAAADGRANGRAGSGDATTIGTTGSSAATARHEPGVVPPAAGSAAPIAGGPSAVLPSAPVPAPEPASATAFVAAPVSTPAPEPVPFAVPAPVSTPAPEPSAASASAEDARATPLPAEDGSVTSPPVPRTLVFDDGTEVEVSGLVLIGRNPELRPDEAANFLINFADLNRTVSTTHLHLALEPDAVWITDRASSKGSFLVDPSGAERPLHPEMPMMMPPGYSVRFGDRRLTVR